MPALNFREKCPSILAAGIKCMQSFTADILVGFLFEESRTNVLSVCVPSHRWVNTERSCIVSVCVPAHRWVGTVDNLVGFCRLCPLFKRSTGLKCGSKCSARDGALKFEVERTIWEHDFFVILSRRLKRSKFGRAGSPKNVSPRSTRCKFRMPEHLKMYFDVQLYNFGFSPPPELPTGLRCGSKCSARDGTWKY